VGRQAMESVLALFVSYVPVGDAVYRMLSLELKAPSESPLYQQLL
jgi:hypothetical protein